VLGDFRSPMRDKTPHDSIHHFHRDGVLANASK
jgi:hypothetical protein